MPCASDALTGVTSERLSARREGEVRRLLSTARSVLGMDVAFASLFHDGDQVFTHVEAVDAAAAGFEGQRIALEGSYCLRVLGGQLPPVLPDVALEPTAHELEVTRSLRIGSYIGVPMTGRGGSAIGMLCCTSAEASPGLDEAGLPLLTMIAEVVAGLLEEDADDKAVRRADIQRLVAGDGRRHVVQPIVDVRTGQAVGVESLSRFDDPRRRPDEWFAEADEVGLLVALEAAAARSGLTSLADRTGYVSLNVSPRLVCEGALDELLVGVDRERVLLEITEHTAVEDYAALVRALAPHRAAGVRLAIDDAGAGYASFRHILQLQPDYIKVDLSLVRDIDHDTVRQALVSSLLVFARSSGAALIAEGVETQSELDTLARLGVTLMQGYLFSAPCDAPPDQGYPTPSRHVVIDGANELSVVLAGALRDAATAEDAARCLLDALLGITGLESTFVSVLHEGRLEQRYVRNAGDIAVREGGVVPWVGSPCARMAEHGVLWTKNAGRDLRDSAFVRDLNVQSYLTIPLRRPDGSVLGSLCGASRQSIHLSEITLAQSELVARLLEAELSRELARS